jgi:hypothetical protein
VRPGWGDDDDDGLGGWGYWWCEECVGVADENGTETRWEGW